MLSFLMKLPKSIKEDARPHLTALFKITVSYWQSVYRDCIQCFACLLLFFRFNFLAHYPKSSLGNIFFLSFYLYYCKCNFFNPCELDPTLYFYKFINIQ